VNGYPIAILPRAIHVQAGDTSGLSHLLTFLAHSVLWHVVGRVVYQVPAVGVLVLAVVASVVVARFARRRSWR
jgi:hypothetical protein